MKICGYCALPLEQRSDESRWHFDRRRFCDPHCAARGREPRRPRSASDRLWARVDRSGAPDSCWAWPGATTANGYGVIGHSRGVNQLVHRVAYESLVGPIPDGMHLHHLCGNRRCVNPAHLQPLTQTEHNATHATGKCQNGHAVSKFGYFRKSGPRKGEYVYCRACVTPRAVSDLLLVAGDCA